MSWDIFSKSKIQYFLQKLKDKFVQKETGKGLSTNDFVANNAVLTTDKTPFLTRQTLNPTGFSGYVREKLIGASYAWNQLNDQTYYRTSASSTVTANAKNGFDASSTAQYIQPQVIYGGGGLAPVYAGHKYLIAFGIEDISHISSGQLIAYGTSLTRLYYAPQKQNHLLIAPSVNGNQQFGFEMQFTMDAANRSIVVTNLICIDLTLAFGSTIADYLYGLSNNGGITKLRDMGFPIDKYTPYGYGLYSVKTSGKKIVGKNLVEDIELGAYAVNGISTGDNTRIKSKNPCLLIGGQTYTLSATSNISGKTVKVAVSKFEYSNGTYTRVTDSGWVDSPYSITAESGFYYGFVGRFGDEIVCDLKNLVIQLELGSSATTYEPYSSTTYPLGNDELRGKFDLVNGEIVASGDVKESNGEITRTYGIVDLGTLNWYYSSSRFSATIITMKSVSSWNAIGFVQPKYSVDSVGPSSTGNKIIGIYGDSVFVKDSAYTDATTFKTAMDGVYLVYELATPTTEQSTPFADPMSLVGATIEEYIDTRDIPCPVGAERQYMGQSADVILIPSKPHADGVSMLMCASSGGKEQYYWDASFMQAFQDGCDEIMGAVAAKGVTPASNSPDDISKAIRSLVTYEQPIEFDYRCGYITNGVWYYENPTDTLSDIYEVKNGHTYYMFFGNVTGTRFRAITTTTDIRTVTSGTITGDQTIKNSSNPGALSYVTFTSTVDGYFIVCKDNVGKTGIITYMQDRTTM